MTSYYCPFKIRLSQKVWWCPLHGACAPPINVPHAPQLKKTAAPNQLGPGSHLPEETKRGGSIEAQNFSLHKNNDLLLLPI